MAVTWTKEQGDAIAARQGTILVSAAAGSGKTAVLVERAVSRLTDKVQPTPADKLLIVTFTRAAAAELRARLEKKLGQLLRENPGDRLLRKQSILLGQATIGTMHSFCGDTIREFFHQLDVPPSFKIITDKQEAELRTQAMTQVLQEAYDRGAVTRLANAFTGERDDRQLSETVQRLYGYMSSHPFPEQWLDEKVHMYRQSEHAGHSPWGRVVLRETAEATDFAKRMVREAMHLVQAEEKLAAAYLPALESDLAQLVTLETAATASDWENCHILVQGFSFQKLGAARGYADHPVKLQAAAMRDEIKETVKKLQKLLTADTALCLEEFRRVGDLTEDLAALTKAFALRYTEKKQEQDFFDFGDLEHHMIRLLADENGKRTSAAHAISQRFDEIMIDEFQDSNEVQDLIFRCVSREEKNLFLVGDVKQSIYGFRRAMPDIFIRYRDSFPKYDSQKNTYPAYIVLDRNFRSRREVTQSVNFVFSQIMSRETGDIDYNREEELVYGADYPEKPGCETELAILSRQQGESETDAEGAYIAGRIRRLIDEGFTVTQGTEERPVRYRDICILLRSANSHAHDYAIALQKQGVPAKAAVSGGFFAAREVGMVLAFLGVIDNPNQDVPLLTVLMSPIYGFSPDDMLRMRMKNRSSSLYVAFAQAAETDPRCSRVLADIQYYRAASAAMPSDAFISLFYQRTGCMDLVLAMEDGENRLANLQLLQGYAREYESAGYNGISGFVGFLERLRRSRWDLQAAEPAGNVEDSVQIMSVHKSKGLEFPVCILAGCDRGSANRTESVLLHPELGLGIQLADHTRGVKYRTMSAGAIGLDLDRRESAEEMRILYVAMTRAREKLILVAAVKNPENMAAKLASQITEEGVAPYAVRKSSKFSQWLMLCALRHPNADRLRELAGADSDIVNRNFFTPWDIQLITRQAVQEKTQSVLPVQQAAPDEVLLKKLRRKIAFTYPFAGVLDIPAKVTASRLTAAQHRQGEPLSRPAFLGEAGMTPAQRGSALHAYMQYAQFRQAAVSAQAELERLVEQDFLSAEEAQAVDMNRVRKFFESSLGRRVLASLDVQKERRFTAELSARDVMPEVPPAFAAEKVVLQGAVDCTFVLENRLHIIDFKTDRVKNAAELIPMYATQIQLYAKAMQQVTGMEIGDCILYSMHTGEAAKVPFPDGQPA